MESEDQSPRDIVEEEEDTIPSTPAPSLVVAEEPQLQQQQRRPVNPYNFTHVMQREDPSFVANPEERRHKVTKEERVLFRQGVIPPSLQHHDPQLNKYRLMYYVEDKAYKEYILKHGSLNALKQSQKKAALANPEHPSDANRKNHILQTHRRNFLRVGERLNSHVKRVKVSENPDDMRNVKEMIRRDLEQLDVICKSAEYNWALE